MQKSFLSKPTLYESFVRTWSASTPASASTTSNLATAAAAASTVAKATVSRGFPAPSTLASLSTPASYSLFKDSKVGRLTEINKGQIRGMASNQPLTQSTMPTAQELKLETPTSEIKTASGVNLDDGQKVIVSSILDLFAGKPSLRKLTLWNDDAVFNDPITLAEGRSQYSAQWYGLATAFSSIKRNSHVVNSSGNPITLDLSTTYTVKGLGTEKKIDSIVEIYLDKQTGKISKVLDKWDGSIEGGGVKHAFRKLNAVSVPVMVSVPKSIEEEEGKK